MSQKAWLQSLIAFYTRIFQLISTSLMRIDNNWQDIVPDEKAATTVTLANSLFLEKLILSAPADDQDKVRKLFSDTNFLDLARPVWNAPFFADYRPEQTEIGEVNRTENLRKALENSCLYSKVRW